jgi:hypothetical protein
LDPTDDPNPSFFNASFYFLLSTSLYDGTPERASLIISTNVFYDSSFNGFTATALEVRAFLSYFTSLFRSTLFSS